MAVSFSSISGMVYIPHDGQLFKHLWKSPSCMAGSFQASLEWSILHGSELFTSISGRVYPAWQSAFQASLEESILHGSELFQHLWNGLYPAWQSAFQASLEWSISCMAVSFSSISGMVYILHGSELFQHLWNGLNPAWQSASQAPLDESILHGSQLFKHLWKSLSCMAVSFSRISGRVYPAWQ